MLEPCIVSSWFFLGGSLFVLLAVGFIPRAS